MAILTRLEPYTDDDGNEVRYAGTPVDGVRIKFTGGNNTLVVARRARIGTLRIDFDNDGGTVRIGASSGVPAFSAAIRVGERGPRRRWPPDLRRPYRIARQHCPVDHDR